MKPRRRKAAVTSVGTAGIANNLQQWILGNATGCAYLLSHAEEGVIWGRFEKGKLVTSDMAFSERRMPKLRLATLWQCRMFGPRAEVLLWRDDAAWRARRVSDTVDAAALALDEAQMLWGDQVEERNQVERFTLVRDGAEELFHAVPCLLDNAVFSDDVRPLRLVVRHYVEHGGDGLGRIVLSRLVTLREELR
jgi:CRISPR-associated protein (TIGR03984 family)